MTRLYSILSKIAPHAIRTQGTAEAKMVYFLATMVELSSETSHSALTNITDGRAMLYRSEIDSCGAEISPLCDISTGSRQ